MFEDTTEPDYQRLREVNALPHEEYRAMVDDRNLCLCGHPKAEHVHRVAECTACACEIFADQNDLDKELNDASA